MALTVSTRVCSSTSSGESPVYRYSSPPAVTVTVSGSPLSSLMGSAAAPGRLTSTPRFISGAVAMKIVKSPCITSIEGPTLISDLLRRRRRLCSRSATSALLLQPAGVAQQNGGKLLAEALIANFQALDLVGKAVEGDHRRNGGKQPHGGGNQRFGNAGRHQD